MGRQRLQQRRGMDPALPAPAPRRHHLHDLQPYRRERQERPAAPRRMARQLQRRRKGRDPVAPLSANAALSYLIIHMASTTTLHPKIALRKKVLVLIGLLLALLYGP